MCPLQLLMGNMSLATLMAIPPQPSITRDEPTPVISCLATPAALAPSSGTKWWHHLPNQAVCSPQPTDEIKEPSEELPHQKQKDGMPLKKLLKGAQQEAFSKDSDLVQQAREAYFRTSHPDFDCEVQRNLATLLQDKIVSASLLDSQDLWNPRDLDWVRRPSVCQWCPEEFTKGSAVLPPHIPFTITQGHGHERGLSPWHPLPLCWINLLPLVWQRRPKWRNHSQPLADNALQARASFQLMSPLPLDHLGGHTTSQLRLQTAQGKWCQRGRQWAWWCIHIQLTDPYHPIWPDTICQGSSNMSTSR